MAHFLLRTVEHRKGVSFLRILVLVLPQWQRQAMKPRDFLEIENATR